MVYKKKREFSLTLLYSPALTFTVWADPVPRLDPVRPCPPFPSSIFDFVAYTCFFFAQKKGWPQSSGVFLDFRRDRPGVWGDVKYSLQRTRKSGTDRGNMIALALRRTSMVKVAPKLLRYKIDSELFVDGGNPMPRRSARTAASHGIVPPFLYRAWTSLGHSETAELLTIENAKPAIIRTNKRWPS